MLLLNFIKKINEVIKSYEVYLFITRDSHLQKELLITLDDLKKQVLADKDEAIKNKDERFANIFLGYDCILQSITFELRMWLDLKLDEPDKAWDNLILAQNSNVAAIRSDEEFEHLVQRSKKLEMIEKLVFPPQIFMSSGMIVGNQECSICNMEYENCSHLKGKPYMGNLCRLIIKNVIEINHVAIVENPANKGCRVTKKGEHNLMTLKNGQ